MKNDQKNQSNQATGKQPKPASENNDREELKNKKGDVDADSKLTTEKKGKTNRN